MTIRIPLIAALILGAAFALAAPSAQADSYAYTGPTGTQAAPVTGSFTNDFFDTTTSTSGVTPASAVTTLLQFGGSGATAYTATNDIAGGLTLNNITLNSTATVTDTIAGNALTFAANGSTGPSITQNGTGAFFITAPVGLGGNTLMVGGNGTGQTSIRGIISGSGGLLKTGSSTLQLTGINTFTGTVTIQDGTIDTGRRAAAFGATANAINIGDVAAAPTTGLTLLGFGGGTAAYSALNFNQDFTLGNAASPDIGLGNPATPITLNGPGATRAITTNVNSGTDTIIGNIGVANGGTVQNLALTIGNQGELRLFGNVALPGTLTISDTSSSVGAVLSGSISGTAAVVKTGNGLASLIGTNNSYTGGTTISGGTLSGTTTGLQGTITDNATLNFDQTTTGSFGGAIGGTGLVTKDGTGMVTFTAANTYSGGTTVNASGGTLALAAAGADGSGTLTINTGGTVTVSANNALGAGKVTLSGGTLSTNVASGVTQTSQTGLGMLALATGNASNLDFGVGNTGGLYQFADSKTTLSTGTLSILDYTGNSNGGGLDQFFLGTTNDLSTTQLSQITFVNPDSMTGNFTASQLANGEIVVGQASAAPEASEAAGMGIIGLSLLGLLWRARRKRSESAGA